MCYTNRKQTGLLAEVRSGLAEGEAVIVHPESTLEPGTRVAARTE